MIATHGAQIAYLYSTRQNMFFLKPWEKLLLHENQGLSSLSLQRGSKGIGVSRESLYDCCTKKTLSILMLLHSHEINFDQQHKT